MLVASVACNLMIFISLVHYFLAKSPGLQQSVVSRFYEVDDRYNFIFKRTRDVLQKLVVLSADTGVIMW